ncbi:MAG: hypothetical protein ACM3Q2_17870 [Syntrophothermus sp.]
MKSRFVKSVLAVMIIITALVTGVSQAQELTKTYGRFLPKDYIHDSEKREQIELLLQAKSRISPDLMYGF